MRGYPTLKWFNKDGSVVDYNGGREESDLTSFALDRWQAELPPPEVSCVPHPPPLTASRGQIAVQDSISKV